MDTSSPTPAPSATPPPKLPPLRHGERVPRHMPARNQKQKQPLKLAEVYALAMWWRETGTLKGTAKACGVDIDTARRYVNQGDPARNIPPLRLVQPCDLPPLPVAWKQKGGAIPGTDGIPDSAPLGEEPAEVAPAAVVLTAPAPASSVARPGAPPAPAPTPGRGNAPPAPSAGAPGPSTAPQSASPPLALPPAAAPARPAAPAMPVVPGTDVGHTLGVANAEVVRLSRNTRTLFNTRIRGLAKLHERMKGDLTVKDAPRLTKSERDMLMVLREVRLTAQDVERLYRLERDILGVGMGAGVNAPPPGQEDEGAPLGAGDAASLEELTAQVQHLLGANPNAGPIMAAAGSPMASPLGGMPVTMSGSVMDRPGTVVAPPASASSTPPPSGGVDVPAWMTVEGEAVDGR